MRSILLTFLLFSVLFIIIAFLPGAPPGPAFTGRAFVIDGDTVVVDRTHIRLKGIDAPEIEQSCERGGTAYRCGLEARTVLRGKIAAAAIRCDSEGHDRYGRVLARCYLGDTDLNGWMVRQGWAVAYGDYRAQEAQARSARLGLWAGSFETPSRWRREESAPPDRGPAIRDFLPYIRQRIDALIDFL